MIYPFCASAKDNNESKLWTEGKVTPEQPFKAKVVAAGGISPWSGETVLYLREDVKDGRFLEVRIGFATGKGVRYTPLENKKAFDDIVDNLKGDGATIFLDPVDITRFVWASPMGGVGQIFGDKDLVRMAYTHPSKQAEQVGADQPATAAESKSEGYSKPQPESEGRSQ